VPRGVLICVSSSEETLVSKQDPTDSRKDWFIKGLSHNYLHDP
jgi:hypothetical protein